MSAPAATDGQAYRLDPLRGLDGLRLRPAVDREFPFAAAPEAYRYYRDGTPFGKVVVAR